MVVLYVILGVVVFFFVAQYAIVLKMRFKKGKPVPQLSGRYEKAVRNGNKALFYFYSDQCGACRPMTPLIEKYAKRNRNVYKVNITSDMDIARKFGVLGTPSMVVVENGVIREFLVGPQSENRIAGLIV